MLNTPRAGVHGLPYAGARKLVGDVGVEHGREIHDGLVVDVRRHVAEIHVEVFDIHDPPLLPRGKPATWRRPGCRSPVAQETQQLDGQEATERLRMQASSRIAGADL